MFPDYMFMADQWEWANVGGARSAWHCAKLTSIQWFQPYLDETIINVIA